MRVASYGIPILVCLLVGCGDPTLSPQPLAKTATLELHVVSPSESANTIEAVGEAGPLFLVAPPILAASDIQSVQLSAEQPEFPSLLVTPTSVGAQKLATATANPKGMRLALVANGEVVGSAQLMAPLTSSFQMICDQTIENGRSLVESLTQ